jgi:hypothetical protein
MLYEIQNHLEGAEGNKIPEEPLGTMHPIYRTDVPLLPRVRFLYIQSKNIFNYFFRLSLTIFVYSSIKCRVFPNVILLGS